MSAAKKARTDAGMLATGYEGVMNTLDGEQVCLTTNTWACSPPCSLYPVLCAACTMLVSQLVKSVRSHSCHRWETAQRTVSSEVPVSGVRCPTPRSPNNRSSTPTRGSHLPAKQPI